MAHGVAEGWARRLPGWLRLCGPLAASLSPGPRQWEHDCPKSRKPRGVEGRGTASCLSGRQAAQGLDHGHGLASVPLSPPRTSLSSHLHGECELCEERTEVVLCVLVVSLYGEIARTKQGLVPPTPRRQRLCVNVVVPKTQADRSKHVLRGTCTRDINATHTRTAHTAASPGLVMMVTDKSA